MSLRTFLLALLAISCGIPAMASSAGAMGAGDSTCREFLASGKGPAEQNIYVQWVSGMIAGIASQTPAVRSPALTMGDLAAQLRELCSKSPDKTLFVAAGTLSKPYMVARPYALSKG